MLLYLEPDIIYELFMGSISIDIYINDKKLADYLVKGVNSAILEWLYSDRENKIIVIHRNPDELLINKARSAIRKAYTGIAKSNFLTIANTIEDTSWAEIKAKI